MPFARVVLTAVLALAACAPAAHAAKPVRGALYTGGSAALGSVSFTVSGDGTRVSGVIGRDLAVRCPGGTAAPRESFDGLALPESARVSRDGTFRAVLDADSGPRATVTGRFGPGRTVTGTARFRDSTNCTGSASYAGAVAAGRGGTGRRVFTLAGGSGFNAFDLPGGSIGIVRAEDEGRVFDYTLHRLDVRGRDRQFADLEGDAPGDVFGTGDGGVVYTKPAGCIRTRTAAGAFSTLSGDCDVSPPPLTPVYLAAVGGGAYVFSDGGQTGSGEDDTRLVRREANGQLTPLAQVSGVGGLAAERDGSVLVSTQNRVLRVSAAGAVSVAAGSGSPRFGGDGGPATAAGMAPGELSALPGGGFVFVDRSVDRIRQVSAAGQVTTFAGGGEAGTGAAGGRAVTASLGTLDVLRDGTVVFSDARGVDLIPAPGSKRLLVGLPATAVVYRAAVRARRSLPVVLTRRARVRLTVRRGGRTVVALARTLGAGTHRIRVPRGAAVRGPGTLRLRVDARAGGARHGDGLTLR